MGIKKVPFFDFSAVLDKLQAIADNVHPTASGTSVTPTGMHIITEDDAQGALKQLDTAVDSVNSSLTQLETDVTYKVGANLTGFKLLRITEAGTYRLKSSGRWNQIMVFGTYNGTAILNYVIMGATTDTKIYGNTQITRMAVSGDNYATDMTIPSSTDLMLLGDIVSLTKL